MQTPPSSSHKIRGMIMITLLFAFLAGSSFLHKQETQYQQQFSEERLKSDSLQEVTQILRQQLREKEHELLTKTTLLDSLMFRRDKSSTN